MTRFFLFFCGFCSWIEKSQGFTINDIVANTLVDQDFADDVQIDV
jgi:hypothetical protein